MNVPTLLDLCGGMRIGPMYGPWQTHAECKGCRRHAEGLAMPQVMTPQVMTPQTEEAWSRVAFIAPATKLPCPKRLPL